MKKVTWFVAIALMFALVAPICAAPMFPDVPANHWARDAVAQLAAKGIVEGYPDGTFKGDRAATRWEMAMVVARLLAKDEQMWATFATKEDLEALKQLVNQLRDELDALGVRVTNLEDNVGKLTKRVWDLEKIRFYGSIDSIFVTQGFGAVAAQDPWNLGTASQYNIHNAIGASAGATIRPNGMAVLSAGAAAIPVVANQTYSAFPVIDYRNGVPLINGTSLTTVGVLGTNLRVSDDVNAGAEFSAYSRVGEFVTGAYYGVVPPYLSNIFTGDTALTGLTLGTGNWTKMTLDNMWMLHKPSGVKLQVGSFANTLFDQEVLYGEVNPNVNGPRTLPFFGFRVVGDTFVMAPMKFEVLMSKIANGEPGQVANAVYNTYMQGFSLDWTFKGGDIKIDYLRAADDFFGGTALQPGGMENPFGWQNPGDYYAVNVPQQRNRPVQAGNGANGLIGPQQQSMYGISYRYDFPNNLKFEAFYGSTNYKPNACSNYNVNGAAGRAKFSGSLFHNLLDLALEYAATSAYYDPFIIPYQRAVNYNNAVGYAGGAQMSVVPEPFWRVGPMSYIPGFYQLHNSDVLTNNRRLLRIFATYHLPSGAGNIFAKYVTGAQIGATASMQNMGLSDRPGFVEPFFPNLATPLNVENSRGAVTEMMLGADYKFPNKFYVKASYDAYRFARPTTLTNTVWATMNNFNIAEGIGKIFLSYPTNDKFLLKAGYDFTMFRGAYLSGPANWNYTQNIPYIGFDYKLSDNTMWSLLAEAYSTNDRVTSTPQFQQMATPWNWNGSRLSTEFKISF